MHIASLVSPLSGVDRSRPDPDLFKGVDDHRAAKNTKSVQKSVLQAGGLSSELGTAH